MPVRDKATTSDFSIKLFSFFFNLFSLNNLVRWLAFWSSAATLTKPVSATNNSPQESPFINFLPEQQRIQVCASYNTNCKDLTYPIPSRLEIIQVAKNFPYKN